MLTEGRAERRASALLSPIGRRVRGTDGQLGKSGEEGGIPKIDAGPFSYVCAALILHHTLPSLSRHGAIPEPRALPPTCTCACHTAVLSTE